MGISIKIPLKTPLKTSLKNPLKPLEHHSTMVSRSLTGGGANWAFIMSRGANFSGGPREKNPVSLRTYAAVSGSFKSIYCRFIFCNNCRL